MTDETAGGADDTGSMTDDIGGVTGETGRETGGVTDDISGVTGETGRETGGVTDDLTDSRTHSGTDSSPRDSPPPSGPARPADPERGLRGAMSAMLVLEALAVLLSIPVARNTGSGTGTAGVIVICALAAALLATCAIIRRPYAVAVIVALQVVMIGCWAISAPLGIMGVIFGLCWAVILYLRYEYRRRVAAGIVPGATPVRAEAPATTSPAGPADSAGSATTTDTIEAPKEDTT